MNADLERTLAEMGPEYRAVVDRMTGAFASEEAPRARVLAPLAPWWRKSAWLAASLLVCAGLAALLMPRSVPAASEMRSAYTLAYSTDAVTLDVMLRTQKADGSWDNDFITQQNAAALRGTSDPETRVAYRRAVRYLRTKGLAPLSDSELRARGIFAARQLAQS